MKYKIEISGGLLGLKTTFQGELTIKNRLLQNAFQSEKRLLNLNPNRSAGYTYTFTIDKGNKKTQEYFFDDTTLNDNFKELLEIAEAEAKVYQ